MTTETSKEMTERLLRSGYMQESDSAEMEAVIDSFIKSKGAQGVGEGVARVMNRSVRSPIGYLKATLSKLPDAKPVAPEPELPKGDPDLDEMTEEEINDLLNSIFDNGDEEAPIHYEPAPVEQIESEIKSEEKDARRWSEAAESWREAGMEETMLNRTESAYSVREDAWRSFFERNRPSAYRDTTWAAIRKLAIQEGTSMHEECRKLGLEYGELIYQGFGDEPLEREAGR